MKFFNQLLYCFICLTLLSVNVFSIPVERLEKRAYTVLKKGSKGDEVKKLQAKLIALGYSCGPSGADGDFGGHTAFCVSAFQQANNLSTDGIAGSQTQTKLYEGNPVRNIVNGDETASTVVTPLSKGSKGDKVTRVQLRLILLGYFCGSTGADGDFGNNTENCVKNFQSNNNLTVTGKIDTATHVKLFSKNAINIKKMGNSAITRFVNTALGQYNYVAKKTDGIKYSKYGEWFGYPNDAWCAMFVSWVASESQSVGSYIIAKSAAVATLKKDFVGDERFGARDVYTPQYGDILFLTNDMSHVAIVVGAVNGYVYTIEGNWGNKVSVVKRSLDDYHISGYGKNYSGNAGYAIEL